MLKEKALYRQLAKLLPGFVTGQIAVARAVDIDLVRNYCQGS